MNPIVINMVQNDAAPPRIFNITRQDGSVVDLTNASSVDFYIYLPNSTTQTNATHMQCSIISPATNGQVLYAFANNDVPKYGLSNSKIVINWSSGTETALVQILIAEDPAVD